MTLAAWLIFKADTADDNGNYAVLPRPVKLHLDDGRQGRDWSRAKAYFNFVIGEALNAEWKKLAALVHPALFHDEEVVQEPRRASPMGRPGWSEEIDDDIPF